MAGMAMMQEVDLISANRPLGWLNFLTTVVPKRRRYWRQRRVFQCRPEWPAIKSESAWLIEHNRQCAPIACQKMLRPIMAVSES